MLALEGGGRKQERNTSERLVFGHERATGLILSIATVRLVAIFVFGFDYCHKKSK